MTIELFFDKFDSLSDLPERIPQVRKFIVSALIHAAGTDQLANELAHQIRVELRDAAFKDASNKKPARRREHQDLSTNDLPPQLRDLPIELFGRLDEVATIEKGLSPIQKARPGPYPLVVTAEGRKSCETFDFTGPAVAIPMVSSTGHGHASLNRIHYQEGEFAAGNILSVVKPICPQSINARFLFEYLTAFKEELLVARMSGTANVSLTINKLNGVPIPLITGLALQRLDVLMALCDQLESEQRERETRHAELASASLVRFGNKPTAQNLQLLFHKSYNIFPADLRKSILTLAVQGKLVPQDPKDEPAESLVARLSDLHPKEGRRRAAPLTPVPINSLPYDLPETWTWARFRDIAIIASNLVNPSGFLNLPHLAPNNIEKYNGVLLKCATVREDNVKSSNHHFFPGQIVYSKIRPNLSKVVIVDFEGLCSADMYPIDSLVDTKYLHLYMLSLPFLVQSVKSDTRVAMPKINQAELNAVAVPVPPIDEQKRIVEKVDELMTLVDSLENQLTAAHSIADKLLEALVAELTAAEECSKESFT